MRKRIVVCCVIVHTYSSILLYACVIRPFMDGVFLTLSHSERCSFMCKSTATAADDKFMVAPHGGVFKSHDLMGKCVPVDARAFRWRLACVCWFMVSDARRDAGANRPTVCIYSVLHYMVWWLHDHSQSRLISSRRLART